MDGWGTNSIQGNVMDVSSPPYIFFLTSFFIFVFSSFIFFFFLLLLFPVSFHFVFPSARHLIRHLPSEKCKMSSPDSGISLLSSPSSSPRPNIFFLLPFLFRFLLQPVRPTCVWLIHQVCRIILYVQRELSSNHFEKGTNYKQLHSLHTCWQMKNAIFSILLIILTNSILIIATFSGTWDISICNYQSFFLAFLLYSSAE